MYRCISVSNNMCLSDSFAVPPSTLNPSSTSCLSFYLCIPFSTTYFTGMIYIWTFSRSLSFSAFRQRNITGDVNIQHAILSVTHTLQRGGRQNQMQRDRKNESSMKWELAVDPRYAHGDGVEKAFSFCLQEKLLRNLITLNMKVCEYHVVWRQTVTQYWRAARIYIWHNIILKMTCVNVSVSTVIYWISIRLSGPRVPKNEKRAPSHRYGVYAHMRTYSAAIHTQIHSIIKIVEL